MTQTATQTPTAYRFLNGVKKVTCTVVMSAGPNHDPQRFETNLLAAMVSVGAAFLDAEIDGQWVELPRKGAML
jgi:hypothetical protein